MAIQKLDDYYTSVSEKAIREQYLQGGTKRPERIDICEAALSELRDGVSSLESAMHRLCPPSTTPNSESSQQPTLDKHILSVWLDELPKRISNLSARVREVSNALLDGLV
jgi:hypothetical protein